jgi:hypothetical protein
LAELRLINSRVRARIGSHGRSMMIPRSVRA